MLLLLVKMKLHLCIYLCSGMLPNRVFSDGDWIVLQFCGAQKPPAAGIDCIVTVFSELQGIEWAFWSEVWLCDLGVVIVLETRWEVLPGVLESKPKKVFSVSLDGKCFYEQGYTCYHDFNYKHFLIYHSHHLPVV